MKTPEGLATEFVDLGAVGQRQAMADAIAARDAEHETEKRELRETRNQQWDMRKAAEKERDELRADLEAQLAEVAEGDRIIADQGDELTNLKARLEAVRELLLSAPLGADPAHYSVAAWRKKRADFLASATPADSAPAHPTGMADAVSCFDCGGPTEFVDKGVYRCLTKACNDCDETADSAPVEPGWPANGKSAVDELTDLLRAAGIRPYWNASPKGCTCPFPRDKCPDCANPCDECKKAKPDPNSRDVVVMRSMLRELAVKVRALEAQATEHRLMLTADGERIEKLESEVHKTTVLVLNLSGAVTRLDMKVAELENKAEARRELAGAAGRVSAASRTELRQRIEALEAMPWNAAGRKPAPPAPVAVPLCVDCGKTDGGNGEHDFHHPFKPETAGPEPHAFVRTCIGLDVHAESRCCLHCNFCGGQKGDHASPKTGEGT